MIPNKRVNEWNNPHNVEEEITGFGSLSSWKTWTAAAISIPIMWGLIYLYSLTFL